MNHRHRGFNSELYSSRPLFYSPCYTHSVPRLHIQHKVPLTGTAFCSGHDGHDEVLTNNNNGLVLEHILVQQPFVFYFTLKTFTKGTFTPEGVLIVLRTEQKTGSSLFSVCVPTAGTETITALKKTFLAFFFFSSYCMLGTSSTIGTTGDVKYVNAVMFLKLHSRVSVCITLTG